MGIDDKIQKDTPLSQTQPLNPLNGEKHETFVLNKNHTLSRMLNRMPTRNFDPTLPRTEVRLLIRGIPETVSLADGLSVILGRAELRSGGFQPDVNLLPYGADLRGVSRVHARLFMQGQCLYLADLYSTNGTYVNGQRLEANDPRQLHNGDELLLGSLGLKVVFS